jgi:hypothetical protein
VLISVAAWTTLPLKLQLHVAQLQLQVLVDALHLFVLHLDGLLLGVEHNVFHPQVLVLLHVLLQHDLGLRQLARKRRHHVGAVVVLFKIAVDDAGHVAPGGAPLRPVVRWGRGKR